MDGYTNVRIVGGGDRVAEFEKLSNNYNGKLYQFDNLKVLSAGDRDPDGDDVSGMSASKQRRQQQKETLHHSVRVFHHH